MLPVVMARSSSDGSYFRDDIVFSHNIIIIIIIIMQNFFVKFGYLDMRFLKYASGLTNIHTNRHTYTPITMLRPPTGGKATE